MSTRRENHKLTPHSHELLWCEHRTTKNNLKFNEEKK